MSHQEPEQPRALLSGSLKDLDKSICDELQTVLADLTRNQRGMEANKKRIMEIMQAVSTGAPNATQLAFEGTAVANELRTREIDHEKLVQRREDLTAKISVFRVTHQN